ncbi:MAG: Virulence factor BrkB [Sphingomonadales bacterium]|nr:Virulence factor BrkB [Sphingomonadales bacterium]
MDIAAILGRVLDRPRVAQVRRVLDIYGRAAGGLLANGLAFSALFAAIPLTLLVLGVGGWIAAGNPAATERLARALLDAFPPLADLINGAVTAIGQGAALSSLFGVVGVIWTVSQLYGALDVAFARIFAEAPERDLVRRTARGLLVVGLIGAAIVAFVVLVSLAHLVDAVAPTEVPIASMIVSTLRSVPFLTAIAIVVLAVTYRTLPPTAPRWRSTFLPAIVVGVVIVSLSQVFTALVPRLVGVAALAGTLASAFIALAWLSFTFQALLYGAAWVRVRDEIADAGGSGGLRSPATPAEPGAGGE